MSNQGQQPASHCELCGGAGMGTMLRIHYRPWDRVITTHQECGSLELRDGTATQQPGEQCDTCHEWVTDLYPGTTVVNFNRHNSEAYIRHLEITGELHVLNCIACGKRTDPQVDEFVPGFGSLHATCEQPKG